MENSSKRIVFFNEYEGIGGGENLIINIARQIYHTDKIVTKIICPDTGYLYKRLHELKIPFEHITSKKKDFSKDVVKGDVLIRTDFGSMTKFKNCSAKLLYWEILPTVFANAVHEKKSLFKQSLISYLMKSNALFFMDKNGVEELERRKYSVKKPAYIPIPVEIPASLTASKKKSAGKTITVTYVGRDVEWKIFPLKKVIEDCAALQEYTFKFIVFCDKSENYSRILNMNCSNVYVNYNEGVYGGDLDNMLCKYADIHFAMGTSALDGAKMGVPTVLLDFSEKEFPDNYRYKFIHHAQGYSLGDDAVNYKKGKHDLTMEKIVKTISDHESYKKLQHECYGYVKENHSLQNISSLLVNACSHTNAVTKNVYQRLAGVYYENRYKKLIGIQ
jgi:hypothetical protein